MKKPATGAGYEGIRMSWYEYKPEPKHYNPEPPDGDSKDLAAAIGLIVPVVLFVLCVGLFLLALF